MRSKYCLQSSFGLIVRIFVLPLNTLKTCLHYMLCKYKREKKGSLWGLQKSRKRICYYAFRGPNLTLSGFRLSAILDNAVDDWGKLL